MFSLPTIPSEGYWVSQFALVTAFLRCTRCQSLPFGRAESSFQEWEKAHSSFQPLHVYLGGFFPSLVMKGQSADELNPVQGYPSYLLAIRYHCAALNYLFQLPRQVCGKFPYSLMGIRLPASNPNSSSAPQHDCEVLLSKGGVSSYVGTDRTVTAGRSMWVSLNKTW